MIYLDILRDYTEKVR